MRHPNRLMIVAFICLAAWMPVPGLAGRDAPIPRAEPHAVTGGLETVGGPSSIVNGNINLKADLEPDSDFGRPGATADPRDGRIYATVRIGTREWFAENLRYDHPRSWCFGNNPANCGPLGRLYDWQGALEAPPPGWRLPTDADWRNLERALGMEEAEIDRPYGSRGSEQGARLKAGGGSGFDALLAGHRGPDGAFGYRDASGDFWSSTEHDAKRAVTRQVIDDSSGIVRNTCPKTLGLSVRCVRDLDP